MAVGPDVGARLAAQAVDLVAAAELVLLRRITERLRAGLDAPQWALNKLAQLQAVRAQMARDLATMNTALGHTVEATIAGAYAAGQAIALADLGVARDVRLPGAQRTAITMLAADVSSAVTGLAPRILRAVTDAYQQAVGAELGAMLTGASTRRQTSQAVLDRLLGRGVTGFTDRAGRNWGLESYVEMAVRTGAGQAMVAGHVDTLAAAGQDLVQVIPGPRACPVCDQWGGKVLSLSGATTQTYGPAGPVSVAGTLDQAKGAGLLHPNCRCNIAIFIPGVSTTVTHRPDPEGYKAGQQQRALERNIRDAKRKEALALDDVTAKAAGRRVRAAQADLRTHLKAHPALKRQSHREQPRDSALAQKPVIPSYADKAAWKARQDSLSVNFHGEVLDPLEVHFVERMVARDQRLEWIPRPPAGVDGRRSSNDFLWAAHGGAEFELKSTKPKYQSVKNHLQSAVTKARKHGVVKEHFIIDIGHEVLPDKVRKQLRLYNQRTQTAPIRSLWILSEDGSMLEQIDLT